MMARGGAGGILPLKKHLCCWYAGIRLFLIYHYAALPTQEFATHPCNMQPLLLLQILFYIGIRILLLDFPHPQISFNLISPTAKEHKGTEHV